MDEDEIREALRDVSFYPDYGTSLEANVSALQLGLTRLVRALPALLTARREQSGE